MTELASADLLVAASGAGEAMVTRGDFERVERTRAGRTLMVRDLGVTRIVEPEIGSRDGVYLYCAADPQPICERNRRARQTELPKAFQIVGEETGRFMSDLRFRKVDPANGRLPKTR